MKSNVESFYDADPDREWHRLDLQPLEWHTTWRYLDISAKGPPSDVLDVGGGPGRYAIALAAQGHRVTLVDLSGENVRYAEERAAEVQVGLQGCHRGDARDLTRFADETFDTVLLLGPLYHLIAENDRAQALSEAVRVLRPGGVLAAAFISIYAPLYDSVLADPDSIGVWRRRLAAGHLRDGVYRPAPERPFFADAWFVDPFAVRDVMAPYGLTPLYLVGAEGMVAQSKRRLYALRPESFREWTAFLAETAETAAALAGSEHIVYFGRK